MAGVPEYADNNHWMNLLHIDSNTHAGEREALMLQLEKKGIQTRPVWAMNHMQKPYKNCQTYKIDQVGKLVDTSLCLPSSVSLESNDINRVVGALYRHIG